MRTKYLPLESPAKVPLPPSDWPMPPFSPEPPSEPLATATLATLSAGALATLAALAVAHAHAAGLAVAARLAALASTIAAARTHPVAAVVGDNNDSGCTKPGRQDNWGRVGNHGGRCDDGGGDDRAAGVAAGEGGRDVGDRNLKKKSGDSGVNLGDKLGLGPGHLSWLGTSNEPLWLAVDHPGRPTLVTQAALRLGIATSRVITTAPHPPPRAWFDELACAPRPPLR